jgi:hypothetical protein
MHDFCTLKGSHWSIRVIVPHKDEEHLFRRNQVNEDTNEKEFSEDDGRKYFSNIDGEFSDRKL